jgi:DNA-binding transcriptional LysR family regulator
MEIKHLETFVVVAETRNFSHAAQHLHMAQSTVTTHIQALENELGVPLFNRLPRQVTLTTQGERLLTYARNLLELESEMVSVVSGAEMPDGTLTIGASETVLTYRLPSLFRAYRERYPAVDLRLRPFRYDELLERVRQGSIDVAFLFDQPLQSQSLHIQPLLEERLLLVAAPGHPLTLQSAVTPADLEGESILFTEINCGYRAMFEQSLTAAGMRPSTNLEFHSLEAIKQCVMAGLGISLLPEVAIREECVEGRLVPLNWSGESFAVWTQVAWSKNVHMCPTMASFIEMSEEQLTRGEKQHA